MESTSIDKLALSSSSDVGGHTTSDLPPSSSPWSINGRRCRSISRNRNSVGGCVADDDCEYRDNGVFGMPSPLLCLGAYGCSYRDEEGLNDLSNDLKGGDLDGEGDCGVDNDSDESRYDSFVSSAAKANPRLQRGIAIDVDMPCDQEGIYLDDGSDASPPPLHHRNYLHARFLKQKSTGTSLNQDQQQTSNQHKWNKFRSVSATFTLLFLALSSLPLPGVDCYSVSNKDAPDPSAKQLHYDLMAPYESLVKPSGGPTNQLTVKMGLRLSQVLDVDEKKQVLTISVWLRQEWYDMRFKWDPSDYGGVKKLNIPSDDLWKPDIVLYNNADGDFVVTLKTKATVYYDGKVVWEPPAIYKSYCPINVEYFPFDVQECFMKFSSWTYHGEEVDLQHVCNGTKVDEQLVIPRGIDMKDYYYNVEWDVLNVTARRNVKFYPCCEEPYPDITFDITLRRRTLFYTLNLIMPCIAISCLTVLVFYLPSDSGEKVTLAISILLALTVFFLLLSDMIPPTSLVIPLIGKYLLFIMIVVTASIFLTVYSLHINFKTPSTDKMSPWVKRIFTEILPRALFMKRPDLDEIRKSMPTAGKVPSFPPQTASPAPRPVNNRANGIEAQDVPPEGDWGAYENLRQRHESGESVASSSVDPGQSQGTTRFPVEITDALKGVRFIANHLRQGDEDLAEERDWKYITMVIDRFFLYIFTTACFGGTLSIFLNAPSLYDPRDHLALVDPNSTCQY